MTEDLSTIRPGSTAKLPEEQRLYAINQLAGNIKGRWKKGETPDLTGVLTHHPELHQYRSVVLDLAYTEYRLRQESGEVLSAETFSRRYPSLENSLYLLIEVQGLLSQDPELQALREKLVWPQVGTQFLHFDLIAEIGRGAFGQVFLATEPALGGRQIVVKVAPHAGGEAELLGKLHHPNIVPVYSLQEDEESGLAAFCMPYLGRATLADILRVLFEKGHPPRAHAILDAIAKVNKDCAPPETTAPARILRTGSYVDGVIHLVVQLAEALAHSHGRGIYHRDLKPSNILMTSDGRPLLLDFNLSIDASLPTWKIGGTLPYMAPEELARVVEQDNSLLPYYDPRSDVFSLGVILYEFLTGKLPYGSIPENASISETASDLYERQVDGPRPICDVNGSVDKRLGQLVESCLAFEPEKRPESALQLALALRREITSTRRMRRWMGNHHNLVFGLSAIFFSTILASALFLTLRPPYAARELQLGIGCYERGEYSSAVDYLNEAIRINPRSDQALFTRGCAFQRLGEYTLALQNYSSAGKIRPAGMVQACKGYCLNRLNCHSAAITAYQQALEMGFGSPAILHNNMGYAYLLSGQTGEAEEQFKLAIQLDDNLQAAHYNMVGIFIRQALKDPHISESGLVHAHKAIAIGPCTADLYRVTAALYAIAARNESKNIQPAIEHIGKAIELGQDREEFTLNNAYSAVWQDPTFQETLQKQSSQSIPPKEISLVDPLDR